MVIGRYLNLACGGVRKPLPWINLDCLHSQFPIGTPERANLDAEGGNYVDHFLGLQRMPFEDESFEGILASHYLEHTDCMEAVRVLEDCRRVLKPGGVLMASVPDASYFRSVHYHDTRENAQRLFGEPIINPSKTTFRSYALFFDAHKMILTEDALWALFVESGFASETIIRLQPELMNDADFQATCPETLKALIAVVNRSKFSVIMVASK